MCRDVKSITSYDDLTNKFYASDNTDNGLEKDWEFKTALVVASSTGLVMSMRAVLLPMNVHASANQQQQCLEILNTALGYVSARRAARWHFTEMLVGNLRKWNTKIEEVLPCKLFAFHLVKL